jgi:hypothetical protein
VVQLAAPALSRAIAGSAITRDRSIQCQRHHRRTGYPAKAIAKNFASLITYPHSERKRFEKRSE